MLDVSIAAAPVDACVFHDTLRYGSVHAPRGAGLSFLRLSQMHRVESVTDLPSRFARAALDPDALGAVEHLQRSGYVAYMVGGCVRDLLLGRRPKDFDIATDATPAQLKRVFRNCRLIGRRFRLAHLYYGSKIIEAATFRGASSEDGLTRLSDAASVERTNTFGSPEEDAFSRDFTVNALFYDPVRERVIDHVGGLKDVAARRLSTIGEPSRRFEEDPVRILRAVKFASRLGFRIAPEVRAAMRDCAPLIATCPAPRVTEEVFRLAESRHFATALELMHESGVLPAVLPEHSVVMDSLESRGRALRLANVVDRMVRAHDGLPRELLYAAMTLVLLPPLEPSGSSRSPSWSESALSATEGLATRMQIPARLREGLRGSYDLLDTMLGTDGLPKKRRIRAALNSPAFGTAVTLVRILSQVDGHGARAYALWTELFHAGAAPPPQPSSPHPRGVAAPQEEPSPGPQRSRGRRRRSS